MPHMDMPLDYPVWDAMLECYQTQAKAGHRYAEVKDHFVQNDLLCEFIAKAVVSFCNRFRSCVAATGGH